jgi:hypothetical protein
MTKPNQRLIQLIVPEEIKITQDEYAIGHNDCRDTVLARISALTPVVLYGWGRKEPIDIWTTARSLIDTHTLLTFQELITPLVPEDKRVSVEDLIKELRRMQDISSFGRPSSNTCKGLADRIERDGIRTKEEE